MPVEASRVIREALGIKGWEAQAIVHRWTSTLAYQLAKVRRRRQVGQTSDAVVHARMGALVMLRELAPAVFDIEYPKPLAIGAREELVALGMDDDAVKAALAWWCSRPAYRAALARGGRRHDLNGHPAGEVSPDHQGGVMPQQE
jgi:hypothetical protein